MSKYIDSNPWAGLSSYEDPEMAKREGRKPKLFCGRDEESHNVTQLITGNIFVTLYGKSGTGKTSLLNAGVFPRLRQKRYLPISIRLSMDALDISFQKCIINQLTKALGNAAGQLQTVEVVPLSAEEQQPDYLWSYFARTKFVDRDGRSLFPVIVFDQFEEIFRDRRKEAEVLLRQIAYMMDESHALSSRMVDGQSYKYNFNFRFVASIREDDLYRLEDSIDNCYLPELKRCRYRLRSLTRQGAQDAILIPGDGLFKTEEQKDIVDAIINKSLNEDGSLSTNIISLLCSRIFADYQKSNADVISLSLVDGFIKGNPFERFYEEATRGFSNREKSYLEDHLIDSSGRRNSIPESDFLLHIVKGNSLLVGDTRILQRTSTSSDGKNCRIELIHDSFCKSLAGQKSKREKRKRIRYWAATIGSLCIAIGIILIIYYQMLQIEKSNWKEMETNSRFLAEKASLLVDEGDSYTAQLLLQEAMSPGRPFVHETEDALRYVMRYDCMTLRSDSSDFSRLYFSQDGKFIAIDGSGYNYILETSTGRIVLTIPGSIYDEHTLLGPQPFDKHSRHFLFSYFSNVIYIMDVETGQRTDSLIGHTSSVQSASYSKDGKYIVSSATDKTIRIWDTETKNCVKKIQVPISQKQVCFSPDGSHLLSFSDKELTAWNAETGERIFKFSKRHHLEYILNSAKYNPDGTIITLSDNKTIYNIDGITGELIGEIDKESANIDGTKNYGIWKDASWQDNQFVALSLRNGVARVWRLMSEYNTQQLIQYLNGDLSNESEFVFSPDGHYIAAISGYHKLYIWKIFPNDFCSIKRELSFTDNLVYRRGKIYNGGDLALIKLKDCIKAWNIHTGKYVQTFWTKDYIASISFNNKYVATGSSDGTISIWDVETGRLINSFKGYSKFLYSLSFSHDNQYLVTVPEDENDEVSIWDCKSGKCLSKICSIVNYPYIYGGQIVDFSPNGKYLAISRSGMILLYDITRKELIKTGFEHDAMVNSVSFSPDGKYLVSASYDKSVRIWDLSTLRCVHSLEGHTNFVYTANYSPDGRYIVSVSEGTIKIWNVNTGKCIETLDGQNVNSAAFSSDGKNFVSVSRNRSIKVWNFPTVQELLEKSHERFKNRQLTPEERRKYYLE